MTDEQCLDLLQEIIRALRIQGYDPHAQIMGYLETGDLTCITRYNGAREKMQKIGRYRANKYYPMLRNGRAY